MKTLVTVAVDDFNPRTNVLSYRITSKLFVGELTLDGASKMRIDANVLEKIENCASAFFDALNEAFFEFAESNSNQTKLKFDFWF
jgi:hypothetical protein